MNENNKVFAFGTAALDFRIVTTDYGENYKDKLLAQEVEILGGGSAVNCLVQVARLGGNAAWLGKLGNDWIGKKIINQLEYERIDCSGVIFEDICSPFNVAVYAGENKRRVGGFLIPNSIAKLSKEDIFKLVSIINDGDWGIVEIGEIPLDIVYQFCSEAKKRGCKIVLDVDLDPIKQCQSDEKTVYDIFGTADIIIPNISSMKTLYPYLNIQEMAEKITKEFNIPTVMTAGKEGAYFCNPNSSVQHCKTYDAEVIDSVGAGDAFHGGMIYGLMKSLSLKESIDLGNKCGAYNCQYFGARTGMPTNIQLELDFK